MDRHARAVPGNKAVPNGRIGIKDGGDSGGSLCGCQNGISGGQEDVGNRVMFLYSERKSTEGEEQKDTSQARMVQLGAYQGGSKAPAKGVDVAVTEQGNEDQERGEEGRPKP